MNLPAKLKDKARNDIFIWRISIFLCLLMVFLFVWNISNQMFEMRMINYYLSREVGTLKKNYSDLGKVSASDTPQQMSSNVLTNTTDSVTKVIDSKQRIDLSDMDYWQFAITYKNLKVMPFTISTLSLNNIENCIVYYSSERNTSAEEKIFELFPLKNSSRKVTIQGKDCNTVTVLVDNTMILYKNFLEEDQSVNKENSKQLLLVLKESKEYPDAVKKAAVQGLEDLK